MLKKICKNQHLKTDLNKWVFIHRLKVLKSVTSLRLDGKLFHTIGPYTLKALLAKVAFLVLGMFSVRCVVLARVFLWKFLRERRSHKYFGAALCKHLWTKHNSLKSTRSFTGSQWRVFNALRESSYPEPNTTLAAQFCIRCSLSSWYDGKPHKMLLT